ncbi:chloride channel protein [Halarchaeum acidiphilum MH1-52-1]|uniref:Chloride channel protein n=1 Tax=Halarchaeum acidiphilum MH1-52-1 TaxID=1261545 RepID=U2YGG3_9EURY|nr:chloride channel protein [Halarchaeum acidiphilum MH1-52-1]
MLVGLTATGFRVVWLLVKHELWGTLTETYWRVVVSVVAGGLIGLILSRTFYPGALSALIAQFHDEGAVPIEDNVPTLPVGLLGLVAGQQAGPEGVMSVVGGSFGTWVADRFGVVGSRKLLTLAGMGAGFGTILGAPIGGALLWLELPHQRGLEYYEALVPTFVASFAGYLTEAGLGRLVVRWRPELRTGPFGLFPSWHVTAVGPLTLHHLAVAVGLGVLVVPVAAFYVETFDVVAPSSIGPTRRSPRGRRSPASASVSSDGSSRSRTSTARARCRRSSRATGRRSSSSPPSSRA